MMISPIISIKTNDFNDVLKEMLQIPVIANYIATHELINRRIIHNECYSIEFEDYEAAGRGKKTTINVYLNQIISC